MWPQKKTTSHPTSTYGDWPSPGILLHSRRAFTQPPPPRPNARFYFDDRNRSLWKFGGERKEVGQSPLGVCFGFQKKFTRPTTKSRLGEVGASGLLRSALKGPLQLRDLQRRLPVGRRSNRGISNSGPLLGVHIPNDKYTLL